MTWNFTCKYLPIARNIIIEFETQFGEYWVWFEINSPLYSFNWRAQSRIASTRFDYFVICFFDDQKLARLALLASFETLSLAESRWNDPWENYTCSTSPLRANEKPWMYRRAKVVAAQILSINGDVDSVTQFLEKKHFSKNAFRSQWENSRYSRVLARTSRVSTLQSGL